MAIRILNNRALLDIPQLVVFGVPENVSRNWRNPARCIGEWETIDGVLYIYEDTIPAFTSKKVPDLKRLRVMYESQQIVQALSAKLLHTKNFDHPKYRQHYEVFPYLTPEKKNICCQHHAVYQYILNRREKEGTNDLVNEFSAFCIALPGISGQKEDLCRRLKKCKTKGIPSVANDGRGQGNHNANTTNKITKLIKKAVTDGTASDRKLSGNELKEWLTPFFKEQGIDTVSTSTINKIKREALKNPNVYAERYGQDELKTMLFHGKLKRPEYVNRLWYIDGVKLPIYYKGVTKEGKKNGYLSYICVCVMDACSGKLIGSAVGKTESGEVILNALKDAYNNTGQVPQELVMDKHSWMHSIKYQSIEILHRRKACKLVQSLNPQRKAPIEREFGEWQKDFKRYEGWHGGGITAIGKDTRKKQEAVKESKLSIDDLKIMTAKVVVECNRQAGNDGLSPNERYDANTNPLPVTIDILEKAMLFTQQEKMKVNRGQITKKQDGVCYEYQIKPVLWPDYNKQEVLITYEDLTECIYVFDLKSWMCIDVIEPKKAAAADEASQTNEDKKELGRQKQMNVELMENGIRQRQQLDAEANAIDAEAAARIKGYLLPKDHMQELFEDAEVQQQAAKYGVDVEGLKANGGYASKQQAKVSKPKKTLPNIVPESDNITYDDLKKLYGIGTDDDS